MSEQKSYKDGESCGHPGCLSHVSHPCEGCGRQRGTDFQDRAYRAFIEALGTDKAEPRVLFYAGWNAAMDRAVERIKGLLDFVEATDRVKRRLVERHGWRQEDADNFLSNVLHEVRS